MELRLICRYKGMWVNEKNRKLKSSEIRNKMTLAQDDNEADRSKIINVVNTNNTEVKEIC